MNGIFLQLLEYIDSKWHLHCLRGESLSVSNIECYGKKRPVGSS